MSNNKKKKPSVADLAKVTKATANYKQEAAKGKGVQAAPMYVGNKPTSETATQKRNEAMQTKEWQRIDNITKERENKRLAAMEKAQKERAEAEKKKRYGAEYELVKKVASGEADEVDKISYNYYKRVRERETNNTLYYLNQSIDDFTKGYNALGGKNYVSADEYDKIEKNAEKINESINRAIEYYELYGSDKDIKEFEKLRDSFSNIMLESNRNKKIMSQFKNENEYNAAREANGVASYAELRQKRDYLQRQKGNGNAADIDAKLNALDKYGLNSNVIKSMSAEDWEYEKERISAALSSAQREHDRYNSTAYVNAHYEDAVNKRGLSEDSARDELQGIIKNSGDKVKYYSDLLNEMTELARMSEAQKDIDAKWGIYTGHSQFDSSSIPKLKKGTSGDVDYDAINYGVVPEAIRTEHGTPENDDAIKRAKKLANISDEEKRMYNFLYNTYGAEKAESYLESIEIMLNKRHTLAEQTRTFEEAQAHPIQATIYNVLTSPLRTAEGLINNAVNIGTTIAGGEIDPYADRFRSSNLSPVAYEGVKSNIDSRVGKFIYSAATQAAELALNMAVSKGIGGFAGKAGSANANLIANKVANVANQVLLSSNSMLSTTLEYKKSGASDLAALGMGMISGAIEAWTERKSLSNLLKSPDIFNEAKAMAKLGKWTKKIGVDAAKEGWEEIEANLYNTLAAFIFEQRNNDSFLSAYDEAIKNGYAENKAFWEAIKAVSPEYLESFAVGALAGGMFGAANTASGVHTYNQVRDDASAFFEDKGYTKSSVMEYLIKNGVSEDTEIARLSNAIVHKANGQMIDDSEIKESPFLSGVLMSYVEGMNTGEITDKTDVKQSVKKEISTLTSLPVSDVGRTGTAVHSELTDYVVSNLIQDGMSREDARRTAESMFELMYKSGKYGVKKEEALTSGAELYSGKYTDYMSAFYSAGVTDANNQVLGKKTAKLIKNDALYQLRKEKTFSRKAERALNAIASKLGVDIEIVNELPGGDNAVWNETTGRLLISVKSKNPIITAAVHDGVHAIRSIDSEAYNSLAALTVEILGKDSVVLDNAMSERLKVYKEEATGEDGKINPDYITEEMVAEVLSHTLNLDEIFINEMAASDRNLVQRIFDAIGDFFERLFKRYTGEKQSDMSPEIKEAVDMLRAESEKIKTTFGKALEVTKNKQRTTMKLPKSGKVMNSKTITAEDVKLIQSIGRKSINALTEEELKKLNSIAEKYWQGMSEETRIKSPFFRRWFGDWREFDTSEVSIVTQKGNTRGINKNKDTGWDIQVSGKVFNETKVHNAQKNRAAVAYLDYINQIVENAILLDTAIIPADEAKSQNSMLMHSMYALADIGNGVELLKLYVEEINDVNSDGTINRAYQLQNIIKAPAASVRVQSNSPISLTNTASATYTVSDLFSLVKTYDPDFKPIKCSAVLNEDGTPKEVYHGTKKFGFSTFDLKKSDDKATIFLTDDPKLASTYSGKEGITKRGDVEDFDYENISPAELVVALNELRDANDDNMGSRYFYASTLFRKDLKHDVELNMKLLRRDIDAIRTEENEGIIKARENLIKALDSNSYRGISTPLYTLLHYSDVFRNHEYVNSYAELESNSRLLAKLEMSGDSPKIVCSNLNGYAFDIYELEKAKQLLWEKSQLGIYETYLNFKTPLTVNANGKSWNNIREWSDSLIPDVDELELVNENSSYYIVNKNNGMRIPGAVVPETAATTQLDEKQLISLLREEARNIWAIRTESVKNTRGIAKIAKSWGYDGVIIKNVLDSGGYNDKYNDIEATVYIAFESNQIKSTENLGTFSSWDDNIYHSKTSIAKSGNRGYNGNTDQYRVMWTLEEGVLSKGEVSAFYAKISEMKKQRYPNYKLSKDGEYIFEVVNKLIYSDGDYDYPEITRVVAFNTDNNYLIEYGRETIYDGNEYGIALQDALEIVKAVYGEEITTVSDFGDSKAYAREWENRRRKRENSRASDSRSGENVRKSKVSEIDSTSEDLPKISATVLPAINLDEKTQAKLNELIKKYGGMESGFNPARNVIVPEKTSDDNYVRRFARTAVESDKVNDEAAVQIMKDIADGEFWTTYERVGNKKSQDAAKVKLEQDGFEKMLREWEATLESGKKLEKQDIVNAQLLLEVAADNGNTELVVRLVSEIAAEATRAGQVVQSMLLLKRLGTAANVYKVERVVSELQRDLIRQRGKKAPKLEIPGELLEEYAEAFDREVKEKSDDHSESDRVAAEIYKAVAEQISSTWIDKLTAWRYLAMLGNPRTHIRNMVGNLAFAPAIMVKNVIATTGESIFIRNIEKRTKSFSGLFSKGSEYQYAKADADAISAVLRGDGKYGETDLITQHQQIFKTKWLDSLRKFNTNLLEKEDWLFLKPHYARALTMYMKAHKLSGEDITAEQLDKARKIAIQEAKKATFRDASAFASWLSMGKKFHPLVGFGVDAVMPFKKTPINVLKRGVEYSPLGILKPVAKGLFKVGEGKYTAAELIDDLAASLSGSGLMVLGLWLASSGILKGRGSDDEEENILQTLGGMQNYSLKVGKGTYTIDWLAPSAMAMFVGCEMYNAFKEGGMTFADIMEALPRITEPVFEMSMLESLSSLVERASYEETSSAKLGAIVADLPASYLGQFVPTLLGQIARTIDPTRRKIYIDKDSKVPDWIQSFVQQQAKKIPVVSFMMEPYVNARGEQELNAEGNVFSRAFQNFLSPGYYKKMRSTAVDDEMARLYAELGEKAGGIMPKTVQKYITVNGERVNLSAEQYSEYQRTTGQSYYKKLGEIISSDYYKALTDEQKVDLLEEAKNYSVEVGKNAALPEYKITNGWLKTAFETDGGFQYILDLDKKESFSEKDLQGESFDKYESDRDTMFDSIISNYKPNGSDYALADKYYDNLYSFTHRVALEKNANGKYAIDTKWMKTAKNLNPKDQAEFIYGTTALSLKDFKEYKDALGNTISRKQQVCEYIGRLNISNRIKSYLFREEYKDRTSKGKSNIAEVTWQYEWLQ